MWGYTAWTRKCQTVALDVSSTHTLTLQRSCCSACRLQWSPLFYLCCPADGRGNNISKVMMCWFHPLWFVLRQLIFTARKTSQFWLQGRFLIETWLHKQKAETQKDVDKQSEVKLKSSLWCFFSHRVLRTSWRIPKTFQPQIPNVTPPDTSKTAAPPHWAQIKACLAQYVSQWKILRWHNVFIPVPGVICSWERIACSWNVLESQQTTEVVWFSIQILLTKASKKKKHPDKPVELGRPQC